MQLRDDLFPEVYKIKRLLNTIREGADFEDIKETVQELPCESRNAEEAICIQLTRK